MTRILKKSVIILTVFMLLGAPAIVFGSGYFDERTPEIVFEDPTSLYNKLEDVFQIVYTLFFIVAAFFYLYSAFLYLGAGGEPDKARKAKGVLLYAVVATIVGVLALSIAAVVEGFFLDF